MSEPDFVTYEVTNEVATITMNRPDLRNVISVAAMQAMHQGLEAAAQDDGVRVIVITGSGNTFCAGADLKGATAVDPDAMWSGPKAIVHVLAAILDSPKPTIARVQGHVAGGGNGLVAACDLSVAVDTAKFAFSEVRLGLAPAVISVVCLARLNVSDGYELFLTGERVSAQRMKEAGLLNQVVAEAGLDAAVAGYVHQLRAGGPQALAATKSLLRRVRSMERDAAFDWTAALSAALFGSDEGRSGMGAFLRREPAPWAPTD